MLKRLTEAEREQVIEQALNAACLVIQDAIGQLDGGPAAIFFSDTSFHDLFDAYIDYEYMRSELES